MTALRVTIGIPCSVAPLQPNPPELINPRDQTRRIAANGRWRGPAFPLLFSVSPTPPRRILISLVERGRSDDTTSAHAALLYTPRVRGSAARG